MKKTVFAIICIMLVLCLGGCTFLIRPPKRGDSDTIATTPPDIVVPITEVPTAEPTAEPTPIPVSVNWSEHSFTETDNEGYVIRQKIKMSPWYGEDSRDELLAAWGQIARGNEFPSESEMGFYGNRLGINYTAYIDYDEVLYCIGTLELFNDTDGFDLSADNTRTCTVSIGGARMYMSMEMFFSNTTKHYYSVPINDNGIFGTEGGGWSPIYASMKANHWGPVPFVIGLAVDKTPNHPDGNPAAAECQFRFGGDVFTLDVE